MAPPEANAASPDTPDRLCNTCKKPEDPAAPLKRCGKCKSAWYCTRECQTKNWKTHKKLCAQTAQAAANQSTATPGAEPRARATWQKLSSASGAGDAEDHVEPGQSVALDTVISKPFHKLHDKTWLHGRTERDVYKLLIDTYRLRLDDDYTFSGILQTGSIYSGATDGGVGGFSRFLARVEQKPGLLPEWWSKAKAAECLALGKSSKDWGLQFAVEKHDIVDLYKNPTMPMQLRMFGEQVYGTGPGGQNGGPMMQMQMAVERQDYCQATNIDLRG
ncbi:MYND domain protein [Penicillium chermesinum]|uniref:MYND domain protein n=1 Tax=Penicillium chermesinum TaxID=63820 RepID=A0A9W9PJ21_9EURO|nr:MYND domain protein [Penicillium chermesinum]KAJ5246177.1 MYND domain protein [Penicillium chermesinum]